jgi:hypothetical protein
MGFRSGRIGVASPMALRVARTVGGRVRFDGLCQSRGGPLKNANSNTRSERNK